MWPCERLAIRVSRDEHVSLAILLRILWFAWSGHPDKCEADPGSNKGTTNLVGSMKSGGNDAFTSAATVVSSLWAVVADDIILLRP